MPVPYSSFGKRTAPCIYKVKSLGIVRRSAASIVLALTMGVVAMAQQHPVPLEPNQDQTCGQCHEDKTKGKFVHSAISTGCGSCHEVRVNRDITRVKLIKTTPVGLCIT